MGGWRVSILESVKFVTTNRHPHLIHFGFGGANCTDEVAVGDFSVLWNLGGLDEEYSFISFYSIGF